MSVAALKLVFLTPVLSAKQFSTLLLRVLPESRLCLVRASVTQKIQSRPSQGRDFHALLTPSLPVSPASAPTIPCLTDSCSAKANCIRFPTLGRVAIYLEPLPIVALSASTVSKQAGQGANRQIRSTHDSLFILQDSDHMAHTLSALPAFLSFSGVRLSPGFFPCDKLSKAVALSWHVRFCGSWYMLVHPLDSELSEEGEPAFFISVSWVIPGLGRDSVHS